MRQDLRHFDNRHRVRPENVEELHEVRQLFHQLRHRSVENLYHRGINGNLLHGTLLIPLLWPPAAHPDRVAGNPTLAPHLRRKVRSTRCQRSSVPVGRCTGPWSSCRLSGKVLTPEPLRSTAAHAEEQLAVVAISAAARLQRRVQPWVAR